MQTEASIQTLVERARDMAFLHVDGRLSYVNGAAAKLLGKDADALLGSCLQDHLDGDAATKFEEHLRDGNPATFKLQIGPGRRWAEASLWIQDGVGHGILRDITTRRQFQDAVRDSERKFRGWLEQIPLGVYRTAPDGRILDGNQALATMLGASSMAELKRVRAPDLFAEGAARARNVSGRLHATGVKVHDIKLRRLDGSTFWARDVGRAVYDDDGALLFFDGTLEDVTEARALHDALEKSEQKHRSLIAQLPVGVYRSRPDGSIEDANPALLELLQFPSLEAMQAANASSLYVHEGDREDWLAELQAKKGTVDREFLIRRTDGTEVWVRDVAKAVTGPGGEIISIDGSIQDITKRKRAEATVALVMRINRAVAEAPNYDEALRAALEAVCATTGWEYGEAWIPGPGGDILVPSTAWHSAKPGLEKFRHLTESLRLAPGEGVAGEVWVERRIGYYPDMVEMPHFVRAAAARAVGLHAGVFVPVLAEGRVTALLVFMSRSFDDNGAWLDAMHAIAGQVGGVFQRRAIEDRLRFQQMLLRAQIQATPDGVLAVGVDGTVLAANDALLTMCGAKATDDSGALGILERLENPEAFLTEVANLYTGASEAAGMVSYKGNVYERRGAPVEGPRGARHGRVWTFRYLRPDA